MAILARRASCRCSMAMLVKVSRLSPVLSYLVTSGSILGLMLCGQPRRTYTGWTDAAPYTRHHNRYAARQGSKISCIMKRPLTERSQSMTSRFCAVLSTCATLVEYIQPTAVTHALDVPQAVRTWLRKTYQACVAAFRYGHICPSYLDPDSTHTCISRQS